ncbi:MAG: hypothetical protein C0425_10040 [Chlorobiaceae bacterium]|nr:hypothetical protein [Chlorobiaceae bacterium]
MKVRLLNPLEWDKQLLMFPYRSAYQSFYWYDTVTRSLGGTFLPVCVDANKVTYAVPCFQGEPWSKDGFHIGCVGYGGPVPMSFYLSGEQEMQDIKSIILSIESKFNLRCSGLTHYPKESIESIDQCQVTHILSLDNDVQKLFDTVFSGNVRTSIRKAKKSGVIVQKLEDEVSIHTAWNLVKYTQKAVGSSYVTPFQFFKKLSEGIRHNEYGSGLYGAFFEGQLIAASSVVWSPWEMAYYLNGWNREYAELCPNYLLIFHLIQEAINKKCHYFNFGESAYESLHIAKKRWGGSEYHVFRTTF